LRLPFFNQEKTINTSEFKHDPEEILLALDVGTRYIKAVLFKANSSSEITIIGYSRIAQKYGAMRDAMIVNIQQVIEACDICVGRAIEIAEKRLGDIKLPTKAVIGIAGELVKGVSIVASYDRENPDAKIELEELESVVEQVKSQSFAGAIDEIADETGMDPDQIEEISTRVDSTEIDGVPVNNPLGFTGTSVVYRVFSTFAPKLHVNSLYELAKSLGLEEAKIVVQPYAIARSIKETRQHNVGAIIIDVGGGTTDIALIHNGGVLGTKMFAFGGDVLTKRLAEVFNTEFAKAEEMKLDYSDQKIGEKQAKEIKSVINQDLQIWVEGVEIALEELLEDEDGDLEKLPPQIYLCGGGASLSEVREVMLSHPWLTALPFDKFPKINYLFPNQLLDITDDTRLLIDPSDVTPASIARMMVDPA
jgi:cell division protein FtsA